ncbi:hypothetical protein GN958_ATG00919 [Phytophthora infestans]|uniref:Uncharacterized protein n=1 Tax=Phytophthora infestans TaxID=4787 RepID=A0A8S9VAH5_PHYIN|nr:hypothetical protein GN958_ATG00919 [Phytophthora infestans]
MPCATERPNSETEQAAEIASEIASADEAKAFADTPNTFTTPFAARAEATGATPPVPRALARVPTTEMATPAISSAASSGPILQVHGSSVLLTMER